MIDAKREKEIQKHRNYHSDGKLVSGAACMLCDVLTEFDLQSNRIDKLRKALGEIISASSKGDGTSAECNMAYLAEDALKIDDDQEIFPSKEILVSRNLEELYTLLEKRVDRQESVLLQLQHAMSRLARPAKSQEPTQSQD